MIVIFVPAFVPDFQHGQRIVLPNLKPSTKTISLRLPQHLLDSIKAAANARDVPPTPNAGLERLMAVKAPWGRKTAKV